MKAAREALSLSRPAFATECGGITVRTLENNEGGVNEAGVCMIEAFVRLGINANWLLTGDGPMLLADRQAPQSPGALDAARLRLAIETAEEGLATAGRVMAADKKSDLVLAIYDLFEEPANTRERVLKLVKLAA